MVQLSLPKMPFANSGSGVLRPQICPKTYESCTSTFFITITSFQDGYLMSGGFVGSRLP
jgi:hypothetical protein